LVALSLGLLELFGDHRVAHLCHLELRAQDRHLGGFLFEFADVLRERGVSLLRLFQSQLHHLQRLELLLQLAIHCLKLSQSDGLILQLVDLESESKRKKKKKIPVIFTST